MAELSIFIVVKSNYAKMEIFIRLDRENKERQTAVSMTQEYCKSIMEKMQFLFLHHHHHPHTNHLFDAMKVMETVIYIKE